MCDYGQTHATVCEEGDWQTFLRNHFLLYVPFKAQQRASTCGAMPMAHVHMWAIHHTADELVELFLHNQYFQISFVRLGRVFQEDYSLVF